MQKRFVLLLMVMALSLPAWAAQTRHELRVDGLACPYCAYGVEKKIKALDGVVQDSLEIRLNEGLVIFRAKTAFDQARLEALINDAGFTLRGLETEPAAGEADGG